MSYLSNKTSQKKCIKNMSNKICQRMSNKMAYLKVLSTFATLRQSFCFFIVRTVLNTLVKIYRRYKGMKFDRHNRLTQESRSTFPNLFFLTNQRITYTILSLIC